jgi:hypothetical protein
MNKKQKAAFKAGYDYYYLGPYTPIAEAIGDHEEIFFMRGFVQGSKKHRLFLVEKFKRGKCN